MPISTPNTNFADATAYQIDTDDVASATDTLNIEESLTIGFFTTAVSGTHASHILTLEVSPDGTDWYASSLTKTGVGYANGYTTAAKFCRVRCSTAEGASSQVNVIIQAK